MDRFKVEISNGITPVLKNLTEKEISRLMRNSLGRTVTRGVNAIRSEYAGKFPRKDVTPKDPYEAAYKGIRGSVGRKSPDIKFSIFDERKATSGAFKLKFLEKGTAERRTKQTYKKPKSKKPGNRGRITGKSFFGTAVQRISGELIRVYGESFHDVLKKLLKKKVK
jgi:hypothetical protein